MNYEIVIGLEVHTQLLTKSKIFCGCANHFGDPPNTNTCPVCLGFPGSLPVLNKEVLNKAMKTALALNCEIAPHMKFDRKNYFYPDLPKNFQISQYDMPLARGGNVKITTDGKAKEIRIKRVHLEEDAAKLFHEKDSSLVDFNRSGTPLMEIVSEPDMNSPEEAHQYLSFLKSILLYLGSSDCNMEEGSLRCDANISVRPEGKKEFGVKVELKNMNSFRFIKKALQYEADRQIKLLEGGEKIIQDTRLWDEAREVTHSMRTKEEAHDYRYFPEPDLLPYTLGKDMVEEIRRTLPELPEARRARFQTDYGLSDYDAAVLTAQKETADYFEDCRRLYDKTKTIANWIMGDLTSELNKRAVGLSELGLKPAALVGLLKLVGDGTINTKMAKSILAEMIEAKKSAKDIIEEKNLSQIVDKDKLNSIIDNVIGANQKSVSDYKGGKTNALMYLVGQIMRQTKGNANPQMVNELLKQKLEE